MRMSAVRFRLEAQQRWKAMGYPSLDSLPDSYRLIGRIPSERSPATAGLRLGRLEIWVQVPLTIEIALSSNGKTTDSGSVDRSSTLWGAAIGRSSNGRTLEHIYKGVCRNRYTRLSQTQLPKGIGVRLPSRLQIKGVL